MPKKLRGMLPHGAILIANMYIVFFLIDRVNTAMNFIDNGLTKGLLLAMCAFVLLDALLPRPRRATRSKAAQAAKVPASTAARQPKHAAGNGGKAA